MIRTYSNSSQIIDELEGKWKQAIIYGVDATKLEKEVVPQSEDERFDIVLFNHPHLGSSALLESEEKHAIRHHVLLSHYFSSAKKVLKRNGVVHVCLCGNQPQTWDVAGAANKNELYCVVEKSIDCPIYSWIFRGENHFRLADVETHYRAKRKFRNGKLGSKHFLSRYGYMHRRTEGELFRGNDKEINVQQSANFVFARVPPNAADQAIDRNSSNELVCNVCKIVFKSQNELLDHLDNPARPDVQTGLVFDRKSTDDSVTTKSTLSNEKDPSHNSVSFQSIDIKDATILVEATVQKEFDSTRIKWLCRQPGFPLSKCINSKRECEEAIKQGRIFVNQKVALDTSRIVRKNDVVSLAEKYEPTNNNAVLSTSLFDDMASGAKIIKEITLDRFGNSSLVVAFKPVGMRCLGQFSSSTLEMTTKRHFENLYGRVDLDCQPISKIDTGCAGLCVIMIGDPRTNDTNSRIHVAYTFTVLAHGTPDESWKSGVYISISKNGSRNWKKMKRDEVPSNSASMVTTHSSLELHDALFIKCQDTYQIRDGFLPTNTVSTLSIKSSHDDGRLANVISYTLRKLGFPVVNDRFAKRESSAWPRRMKNLLKQKVCIGCYRVDIYDDGAKQNHTVSIEPHNRTQCKFWREYLKSD